VIEIELVGGPEDGARWAVPADNPPPIWRMASDRDEVLFGTADALAPGVGRYWVWRLRCDPAGFPSRDDAGVYLYEWKGVEP
jgi:hypothetical protein